MKKFLSNQTLIKIKKLFLAKWIFKLPKKNKFILYDGLYNPFVKYINKNNFTTLYIRGEEINFFILFLCLLKKKFSFLDYSLEFIKHVSPKIIISAYDHHTNFYKLSKITKIKTIMFQKGKRSIIDRIIKTPNKFFSNYDKKENFVDYMFLYNNSVKNFYKSKIGGKIFETGSFENNFSKINKNKQKNEILFISNYNLTTDQKIHSKSENENIIAKHLCELAKKNKLKFNILPRNRNDKKIFLLEYNYYKSIIKDNFTFLNINQKSGYKSLDKYKYIFSSYSTMAIEALAKGCRCGFVFYKSKTNPIYGLWFASFEKFKLNGPFWYTSDKLNKKKIENVFNFVTSASDKRWSIIRKKFSKKLMKFDYKNKIFRRILRQILKQKNKN